MSNATKNKRGTPRVGVWCVTRWKLMDSEQKLMDTSDVEDAEKSGQHVLRVEFENATKAEHWLY